jgi:hypothetical protein
MRITVQSQPGQIVPETLSRKNPSQYRAGGVAKGLGPEFKPQYRKKKKQIQIKRKNVSNQQIQGETLKEAEGMMRR